MISICIPSYNNVNMLKRLLDSIQVQDYREYEVIVTDDSTSDEVEQLVKGYEFVQYFRNENRLGATANCNAAIRHAKGDYIKLMHHDDWFTDASSLRQFAELAEQNPEAMFVFSGSIQVGEEQSYSRCISPEDAAMYRQNYRTVFLRNKIGAPSAVMFRNTGILLDEKLTWLVDMDLYLRLLEQKDCFAYTEDALVSIGVGKTQLTQQCVEDKELQIREYVYVFRKFNLVKERVCRDFFVKMMIRLQAEPAAYRGCGIPAGDFLRARLKAALKKVMGR